MDMPFVHGRRVLTHFDGFHDFRLTPRQKIADGGRTVLVFEMVGFNNATPVTPIIPPLRCFPPTYQVDLYLGLYKARSTNMGVSPLLLSSQSSSSLVPVVLSAEAAEFVSWSWFAGSVDWN